MPNTKSGGKVLIFKERDSKSSSVSGGLDSTEQSLRAIDYTKSEKEITQQIPGFAL